MSRFNQLFTAAFGVSGALAPLEPTPIELTARRLPASRVWGAAYYSPSGHANQTTAAETGQGARRAQRQAEHMAEQVLMATPQVDSQWFIDSATQWLKKGQRAEQLAETRGRNCAFHRRRGRNEILRRFLSGLRAGKSIPTLQEDFFALRQSLRLKVREIPDGERRWYAEGKMREAYSLFRAMVWLAASSGKEASKEGCLP